VRVVGETSLMLHIEVDPRCRARAHREGGGSGRRRDREGDAMLGNDKFVARAPAHVVDEHRARLGTFVATLEQLKTQLARLSS
jgi:valyl-tRNA synthetase